MIGNSSENVLLTPNGGPSCASEPDLAVGKLAWVRSMTWMSSMDSSGDRQCHLVHRQAANGNMANNAADIEAAPLA